MNNSKQLDTLCHNIFALRKSRGLSKKKMAEILCIGTKSLTALEGGTIPERMSCAVLFRAAEFFGVSVDDLLLKELL